MSSMLWLAAAAALPPAPASAEQVAQAARDYYAVPAQEAQPCPESAEGEIVVCAEGIDPATQYVPSSTDDGAIKDNVPRAPDLVPRYPGVVVARGCFIPPCPRPMPLLIDLKAIPEAPPGSDADRIAKGEIPAR